MSKTCLVEDPSIAKLSGPRGEVSLSTLVAVCAESTIKIHDESIGIRHATEGLKESLNEETGVLDGIIPTAKDPPHNALVRCKPPKIV